jgi:hypothetical protein
MIVRWTMAGIFIACAITAFLYGSFQVGANVINHQQQ